MRVWDLPKTEQEAISFFQERNILPKTRKCVNAHDMTLYFGRRPFWKCKLRQCHQQVGLRKHNWFERSKIPFCSALRFIYCWCEEWTSIKFCKKQIELSDKTVIDWNNYMRELCVLDMDDTPNTAEEWDSTKWRIKSNKRTSSHQLESHMSEVKWRQHQKKENRDCFESILNCISTHFPPNDGPDTGHLDEIVATDEINTKSDLPLKICVTDPKVV